MLSAALRRQYPLAAAPDLGFIGLFAGICGTNKMRVIIWMEEIT
jgi:hypothetical protein